MKFKTLDNREIRINIVPENYPVRSRAQSKSSGQYALGRVIRSVYGYNVVLLEEFSLPGERLFLDFYLPHHKLAFEFQGRQHDEFTKFFHGSKKGFQQSQARDARKRQWCELNSIVLVEVRDNVLSEELQQMITEARLG